MKDFKNSFEQRQWEYAAASNARAEKVLSLLAPLVGVEDQRQYWINQRDSAEKNYPSLSKPVVASR